MKQILCNKHKIVSLEHLPFAKGKLILIIWKLLHISVTLSSLSIAFIIHITQDTLIDGSRTYKSS